MALVLWFAHIRGKGSDCRRRKSQILDADVALFADYSYFGVSTRDIVKKARVTEGSIYRLFTSKDQLFAAALQKWYASRWIRRLS